MSFCVCVRLSVFVCLSMSCVPSSCIFVMSLYFLHSPSFMIMFTSSLSSGVVISYFPLFPFPFLLCVGLISFNNRLTLLSEFLLFLLLIFFNNFIPLRFLVWSANSIFYTFHLLPLPYLVPFPSVNILSSGERKTMADKYKERKRREHKRTIRGKGKRRHHKEKCI